MLGMENGWAGLDDSTTEAGRQAGRTAGRWLDVKQAAEELGISSDAVRKRVARGTLRSAKREDGSVKVWLDAVDDRRDEDQPAGGTEAGHRLDDRLDDLLIEAREEALRDLRDQLEHMRRQLDQANERDRENRRIIAGLVQRVPELEQGGSRVSSEDSGSGAGKEALGEAENGPEHRSWWRRFFGF